MLFKSNVRFLKIFQSTHPRGVRLRIYLGRKSLKRFQSTHPRGVRRRVPWWGKSKTKISIHAPTRGATCATVWLNQTSHHFNPRTHEGCDFLKYVKNKYLKRFQSTHPRGVRLKIKLTQNANLIISIHAPTRGATKLLKSCASS